MNNITLGEVEKRFAEIIWQNEPLSSRELVALCAEQLDWKKSTVYTVLKKLCDKGIFQNANGTVCSLMTREEYFALQSEQFVNDTFKGSLPAFIAAFTRRKALSDREKSTILKMIEQSGKDD